MMKEYKRLKIYEQYENSKAFEIPKACLYYIFLNCFNLNILMILFKGTNID